MAEVFLTFSYDTARRELMRIYESLASGAYTSLRAALRAAYDSLATVTASGLIVSGTSANGFSTTFSQPGQGADRPQDRQQMLGYLIELADELSNRVPVPTDDTLYADMLANLQPARAVLNDYSGLRV